MSFPLDRFYHVNRIFLSIVGLWPYQEEKTNFRRNLCVQVILISGCLSHYVKLVSMDLDLDDFLKILPFSFLLLCIMVMFYGYRIQFDIIKITWDHIQDDWDQLINTEEMNILEEYATIGKKCSIVFIVMFHLGELFLGFQTFLPLFLDKVLPLNESREFRTYLPMELMFDQEKHLYPALFLLGISLFNVGLVTSATYGTFAVYIQHACGLFRLVGFSLDEAYEKTDEILYNVREDERIYKNLVRSIRLHRRAIEFIDLVNALYDKPYLVQLLIGTFIIGLNMIQIIRMKTQRQELNVIIMCLLQIVGTLGTSLVISFISQRVIDHSIVLFEQAYITPWQKLCPKTQRLLLMFMMNSLRPCFISIGKMFVSCNEFYMSFLQTVTSYAMVIYSLQ